MIPIVREHGGEVNQLLGDGLLAVFRTPDHADRALARRRRDDRGDGAAAGSASA